MSDTVSPLMIGSPSVFPLAVMVNINFFEQEEVHPEEVMIEPALEQVVKMQ